MNGIRQAGEMKHTLLRHSITLEAADAVANGVVREAERIGIHVVVAVLDESGLLKAFRRMDGAFVMSIVTAQRKAYTALTGVASHEFVGTFFPGESSSTAIVPTIPGILPAGGGIPVEDDGVVIGAVGVSGGTVEQDIACARVGIAVVNQISMSRSRQ